MTDDRKIVAVVGDLLVGVQIQEAGKRIGAQVEVVEATGEATSRIRAGEVALIVVDLAMADLDVEGIAGAAREAGVRAAGFYPHVNAELRQRAKAAGIELVYPRSKFLREIARTLQESLAG